MRPYVVRPTVRTRFQPPVSFATRPFTFDWPLNSIDSGLATNPSTNIMRTEDAYKIQLAVPGIPKDRIQLEVVEDKLIVSTTNTNQETENNFVRKEFDFTNFKRSFTLHKNADVENLNANFENGILTIVIPDKAPETRKIEIQ